ncbi:UV radiation resistance protein and autophagy-related subunit 14-domain-containing protein [Parachaetomium inaequale]|uniref:Autophagy-related protein 14 n=1 Tax=Parachaetomium inaequale TaxID=2588326 RepID=A0AAN6PTC5_9PEZI|nr:UV radiation resistance protein and autophagy-related subunit 14-domain-containing protein [Parachaetomium inaequale]
MVNCSICNRPHDAKKLPFLCAVDTRNRLYAGRVDYAQALIASEEAEHQVEAALSSQEGPSTAQKPKSSAHVDRLRTEEAAARDRTSQIIAQADQLKSEIDAARREIAAKKDAIARKKSDLASVSAGTATRRNRQLEEAERSMQRLRYKWNRSADSMADIRAFLCEGSARLYGLRQVRKGSVKRYEIGGVEIFDLHAMNSLSPDVISTSLAHIAHILVLAARYLGIRLPAEITPPHPDYPRPTIFSLASSYKHGEVPFPGSLASQIPSVVGDDGEQEHVPRPRPLFIDKPLPTLAREDPAAYKLFLEGASLLAYDIAWACCSQGVSFGDKDSYEDVCNMGQNLWRLLIGDQLHRRSVEPTFRASLTPPTGSPRDEDRSEITNPKSTIGRWSHGTLHSFLGGAEGTEFVRNFKIMPPLKLADRLKKRLSSEAPMLEWEKIEGDELDDGFDDGVLVRGHGSGGSAAGRGDLGAASIMTVRAVGSNGGVSDSAKGTSGWTRLKNR